MSAIATEPSDALDQQSPERPIAVVERKSQSQRIYYLDNLRALAMLLGVFLHSALAYANPAQSVWLATDTDASVTIDASVWFIHLFRMALFFLLSGYFAKLVIERKGLRHFVLSRSLRIVAPFVLFYPFLLAAISVVFVFALRYLKEPQGLMGMIAAAVNDTTGTNKPPPASTMHLWFLYYLMAFSAMGAVLYNVKWIRLGSLFRRPALLWFCPLILIPGAMAGGTPLNAPESFVPDWWPFAFYGLFFWAGWEFYGRESFLDSWLPYAWHLVVICAVLYVPYYYLMPVMDLRTIEAEIASRSFWMNGLEALLTAYMSVALCITSLLLGQRYLAGRSSSLAFIADSSYWVYLVHLPIVLFMQTLMVPMAISMWLKFAIVLFGTLICCLATYVVFVRYTPLGWLLHGKRSFP